MEHERQCIVCGEKYKYCPRCSAYKNLERWHMVYCSEECMKLFHIYDDYRANKITQIEAYSRIRELNSSTLLNANVMIKEKFNEIICE